MRTRAVEENGRGGDSSHLSVLGGGVGGLAVGYYARRKGIPFRIYESSGRVGGNCVTFREGDFSFDSGAHRFHDQDRKVTRDVLSIMNGRIGKTRLPSHVYSEGKLLHFPLLPLDLLVKKGITFAARAVIELIAARVRTDRRIETFEDVAVARYGRKVAENFLINYSEKLWGIPCATLSASAAGRRLKGLNLRTFIVSLVSPNLGRIGHLEGDFYYPEGGIGSIAEGLADICGRENIRLHSTITKVLVDHERVTAVEINASEIVSVDQVVSTLPISTLLRLMLPRPPQEIIRRGSALRFRDLRLVVLLIRKERVIRSATVYFPDKKFIFTRICEPKNTSHSMAPEGMTSLVAEVPCYAHDDIANMHDNELEYRVRKDILRTGLVRDKDISGWCSRKLEKAYPVLECGHEKVVAIIINYLRRFRNLRITGRNGTFTYSSMHDMFRDGKEITSSLHC
jgi:protoporphyrinogen oxidase